MTATIAVSMPDDVYLQRLRALGAWWRLGSSLLNPNILASQVEYGAFAEQCTPPVSHGGVNVLVPLRTRATLMKTATAVKQSAK